MTRTRVTFFGIVFAALAIIILAIILQFLNGLGNGAEATGDGEAATDLPRGAVLVTLASSNTKRNWLDQVTTQFNAEEHTTSAGNRIIVQVSHVTSGGSMNAILDGSSQPVAWSPGDQSWVEQANAAWQQRENKAIASEPCPPTIYAPLGFAMWRPMAELLGWPDEPIGWDTIVALAADPEGWSRYGRPEWGEFRFGHTHPAYANSGLLSMTAFVYGIAGQELTPAEIYSEEVQSALFELEQNTSKYGRQAPALLELMAREGPSYLHAAAVPEADTVRFNVERADDHPYCILDHTEWVTPEEAEAAALFRDYLLEPEQQALAVDNYLRPLDESVPLHAPMDLEHGTDPRVSPRTVPALPSPNTEISNAIIDIFRLNKRKATVLVVLDVSGSMEGEKIKTAREATVEFLDRLNPDDEVGVLIFNDLVITLADPARVGNVVEGLTERVGSLLANGNTALYQAVCDATEMIADLQQADLEKNETRLYGVVLLSDGEDTVGRTTENQMFATCLPANAEADGVKIFPIAFGAEADEDLLSRLATVTGGRMFTADPDSVGNVYLSISAEQ
jgi:Ca-activated chloride channel family protein